MKNQKGVTAFVLSSTMVLAALTGCAGAKDKDVTTTAAEIGTTAEQTTAASTEASITRLRSMLPARIPLQRMRTVTS